MKKVFISSFDVEQGIGLFETREIENNTEILVEVEEQNDSYQNEESYVCIISVISETGEIIYS